MMNLFVSYYRRDVQFERIVTELVNRGFTVRTNFEDSNGTSTELKTDRRLERIRRCDAFIFFAEPGMAPHSTVRQIEFGYALGREKPVAFVGDPLNSLHRWGDVFNDTDDFLDQWYFVGESQAAVA